MFLDYQKNGRNNKQLERKTSDLPSPQDRHPTAVQDGETQPLMMRHISMTGDDQENRGNHSYGLKKWVSTSLFRSRFPYIIAIIAIAMYLCQPRRERVVVVPIEKAIEHRIDIGGGKSIWFRTWGTHSHPNDHKGRPSSDSSIPAILFVHGGPGQAVADYENGNKRFFDAAKLFVVEVDQRGTGNSQPSIRDDAANMKYYTDVSIDLIANDYEAVKEYLGIKSWVVWGGSYGSTIALNYCMRYSESCVALLLRGIYLDTEKELAEVYSRRAFGDDERKLEQFDMLYDLAREDVEMVTLEEGNRKWELLDPNDDRRLLETYEQMILRGEKRAIWMWYSFENNLMEDRPELQLDPNVIAEDKFPEAQSLAFFETRLWLHGTFEAPSNILARVDRLGDIPIWICQGIYDNVCPVQNAWSLVKALKGVHHRHPRSDDPGFLQAYFLDANHEDTDPVMERCLKKIMNEFLEMHFDS